jgi:hypothetical protein
LIHKAKEILSVDEEIVILAIRELSKEKELFLEDLDPEGNLRAAYFAPFYVAEKGIAQRLMNLRRNLPQTSGPSIRKRRSNGCSRN